MRYTVVRDSPEAGYRKGDLVVIEMLPGPGPREVEAEIASVIMWLGAGALEERPSGETGAPEGG